MSFSCFPGFHNSEVIANFTCKQDYWENLVNCSIMYSSWNDFLLIGQKSVAIIYDFQVPKHSVELFEGLINAFEYLNPRPWLSSEKN